MTYRVEEIHIAPGADDWVHCERLCDGPRVRVPERCPDCNAGPPETLPPLPGFTASLLFVHEWSCPAFWAGVRDQSRDVP